MENRLSSEEAMNFTSRVRPDFIEVKIGGKIYKLKLGPEQQPEYLKKLAVFVDQKVAEFKKFFPTAHHETILMLTLLNFADMILTRPAQSPSSERKLSPSSPDSNDHTRHTTAPTSTPVHSVPHTAPSHERSDSASHEPSDAVPHPEAHSTANLMSHSAPNLAANSAQNPAPNVSNVPSEDQALYQMLAGQTAGLRSRLERLLDKSE